jgi:hypothetical protein
MRSYAQISTSFRRSGADAAFGCMTWMIAAVSVHDAMLVVINQDVIAQVERNPIGRWLIAQQGGEVGLFLLAKLCGTALVCAVLITLYQRRRGMALSIAAALTCFQLGLLLFLSLK